MSEPPVLVVIPALESAPTRAVIALLELRLPAGSSIRHELGQGSIAYKRNKLAEAFVAGNFGALLFLDHDMCPTPDTVERLLAHGLDICGALYFGREPPHVAQVGHKDMGGWRPLSEFGGIREVDGIGTGCLLVRRSVFERIPRPWFIHPFPQAPASAEDEFFMARAAAAGIKVHVDTDLVCGHLATIRVDREYATAWQPPPEPRQLADDTIQSDLATLLRWRQPPKAITPVDIANGGYGE